MRGFTRLHIGFVVLSVVCLQIVFRRKSGNGNRAALSDIRIAFYCIPKPFGIDPNQDRSIASWGHAVPGAKVVLVPSGDSDLRGLQQRANELGAEVQHAPLDPYGWVLQNELFAVASRDSWADVVVVINSDIVLFEDFPQAVRRAVDEFDHFLMVGARYDIAIARRGESAGDFDRQYFRALQRSDEVASAILHSYGGVDYYAWKPGGDPYHAAINGAIPPFTYGKGKADNWIVHQAGVNGAHVIDSSLAVRAVHFSHAYSDGGQAPLVETGGKVQYKNHWASAEGPAVQLNKFLFFQFGKVTVQQGVPWEARWRLSTCVNRRKAALCLEERSSGSACPCEYNPFTQKTLSPLEIKGNLKICGHLSPKTSYVHPDEKLGSDLLAQWTSLDNDLIVLGFNSGYFEMLESTVCRFRELNIRNFIAVAFDDAGLAACRAAALPCVAADEDATTSTAAMFGSPAFRSLTKFKSRAVLRFMKLGFNVLWSDIDVFWFQNALQVLKKQQKYDDFDILIQSNAPADEDRENNYRRINSGFYYVRTKPETVDAFQAIVDHAASSQLSEQPSFYSILCGDDQSFVKGNDQCLNDLLGVRTLFLPRSEFPNGNTTAWQRISAPDKRPSDFVIIHNNWIAGRDEKLERFKASGLLTALTASGCSSFR